MDYKIEYSDNEELKVHYLNQDEMTVGRLGGSDIELRDDSVSRRHCKLVRSGESYQLIDLNSSNGSYVNGCRVHEKLLEVGDVIGVGRIALKFLIAQKEERYHDTDVQTVSMIANLGEEEKPEKGCSEEFNFLSSLTNLGKSLIMSENVEDSFQKVADFVFDFVEPEKVYVFHYDAVQNDLYLKYSRTKKKEEIAKISKTIALRAIREKVAILSSDTREDVRFGEAQSVWMYGITSAISVPIWTKDAIYGLIYVDTTSSDKIFDRKDLERMSIIANFAGLSVEALDRLEKLVRERRLRSRLGRYHSPGVVSRLIDFQGDTGAIMPYQETEASVLFIDIVDFTNKAEGMTPLQVGIFLNHFFTEMTEIIFRYQGTLDKFIGDAIMAVFGIPFELKNHAEMAVHAAVEMLKRLREMNGLLPEAEKIKVRIGIHSGKLIAGDFGSPKRLDYTVLGNTVNVASRLESSIAGPDEIVVSEAVYMATRQQFEFKEIGEKKLDGISEQVNTYQVIQKKE